MKKLPYGNSNFQDIIERQFSYVDKTRYIELLENENNGYQVMLRPRRFGKSLFLSVLENYYDIARKNMFESLFGGLYIGKNPTPERGKYAVIRFDFSSLVTENHESFKATFFDEVERCVASFLKKYNKIFTAAAGGDWFVSEPRRGFAALLSAFDSANFAGIPVFVLIDEYDNFANSLIAMGDTYKDEVMSSGLVRSFYKTLKAGTSTSVRRMFVTGVSPMMQNDLTSGFNMANNISLKPKYNEMFGFTRNEVEWLMRDTGVDEDLITVDMEYYYNGYKFSNDGADKVYNSQMVLFLFDQVLELGKQPEQIVDPNLKTSYKQLQLLTESGRNRERLLEIISVGGVPGSVHTSFSIDDLSKDECFISLLFYLGMLTCGGTFEGDINLTVPNYSVQTLYWEYLAEYISRGCGEEAYDIVELSAAVRNMAYRGDVASYVSFFAENFLRRLSNRDLRGFDEKYVKAMMLASLYPSNIYSPISEYEIVSGYSDIYLMRKHGVQKAAFEYVFEVKYVKKASASKDEIEKGFDDAFAQIKKYREDTRFVGRDDIKFASIVFIGKDEYELRMAPQE